MFQQGKRASGKICRVISLPGTGLIGIAVSRSFGSQPCRSHIRRRTREALRTLSLNAQFDSVVVVHGSAGRNVPILELAAELDQLFSRTRELWASESASS